MTWMRSTPIRMARQRLSSIGFSGCGFLACYHLGVVACLNENNVQFDHVLGVSGGALVAAGIATGVQPLAGMKVVHQISIEASKLAADTLHPGFSLVDVMELHVSKLLKDAVADNKSHFEKFKQNLHIGLTDRRVFPPVGYNPKAYLFVDEFRDVEDLIAACVLSCFIPGLTGPALGNQSSHNKAVDRATTRIKEMIQLGFVKQSSGVPLRPSDFVRETCWDGGLVNAFPRRDDETVMVTPFFAEFPRNRSINPVMNLPTKRLLDVNPFVKLHFTRANATTLRQMALSSKPSVLDSRFKQGFQNTMAFLNAHRATETGQEPTQGGD